MHPVRITNSVRIMEFLLFTILQILTLVGVNSVLFELNNVKNLENLTNMKNHQEFDFLNRKMTYPLRISSSNVAPFTYKEKQGKFNNGIEYRLFKVIAEREHLALSFSSHNGCLKRIDLFAGGLFPNATFNDNFSHSKRYYQDDLTWCIQKAKNLPMIFNIFVSATPECWLLLIFGVGYTCGFLFYIMIQFDLKYEKRNQRDWHYTTWLISLPSVIGVNQRFQPKSHSLRFFYGFYLVVAMFAWQNIFLLVIPFIKKPIYRPQISTIHEIIKDEFRLAGSTEVHSLISFDERVPDNFIHNNN